ncbi:MAG TPA: hypothetical protein VKG79_00290 [Bryobacteraceae bacterium]|nr:hypothetical protein [Bryobacteraceae bacterium]
MRLYRVICAATLLAAVGLLFLGRGTESHAQELTQHYDRKDVDKGPRALGLVQITDKGKARFVPIAVMMNGKFYDAESYKATPVPMALDFGIVYEGFRAGVSQGLFTITQPGQLNHEWIAEGTWLPEGAKPKTDKQKYAPPVIDEGGRDDDHPVLHRRAGGEADKDDAKPATPPPSTNGAPPSTTAPPPASTTSSPSPSAPSTTSGGSTTSASKGTDQPPAAKTPDGGKTPDSATSKDPGEGAAKAPSSSASRTSDPNQPISDPNRPVLRRGKPDPNAHHEPYVNFDDPAQAAAASKEAGKEADAAKVVVAASVQTLTAISDAGGPDPRPYTYDVKPAEEAIYRNKMLELAGQQLRLKTPPGAQNSSSTTGAASAKKRTAKTEKPEFEDLNLRIFDLSNSNEPVLVLSARTPVPPATASGTQVPREITLIARTNLEGELQKLFFAQTDSRHLDLSPRMELIDAVDADGDGRGELLFRRTFESGSAYAIYRVTADGLWPLWEPTP